LKLKKSAEDLFGGTTLRLNELILLTGKLFANQEMREVWG
jgi:hypothetical protein